jgi:four helix bundle protein
MQNEKRPHDIQERTFAFAVDVVRFCHRLDERPGVGRTLSRQLLRSATSVGANREEAQAGQSRNDFISKTSIALKEARETLYWLRLIRAAQVSSDSELPELQVEAQEITKIPGAIIISAKKNNSQ